MGICGLTVRNVTYMLFTHFLTGCKLHSTFFPDTNRGRQRRRFTSTVGSGLAVNDPVRKESRVGVSKTSGQASENVRAPERDLWLRHRSSTTSSPSRPSIRSHQLLHQLIFALHTLTVSLCAGIFQLSACLITTQMQLHHDQHLHRQSF